MYLSCPAMTSFPYLWGKLSNFCIFVQRIKLLLLVFEIVKTYLPEVHCYGDDTQAYISFSSNLKSDPFLDIKSTENCILDIRLWILNDCLKLNDDKTEFLIIGTPQQLGKVNIMSIRMGNSDTHPVPTSRNLRHVCVAPAASLRKPGQGM